MGEVSKVDYEYIYCEEYWVMYGIIESLCGTPKTVMLLILELKKSK